MQARTLSEAEAKTVMERVLWINVAAMGTAVLGLMAVIVGLIFAVAMMGVAANVIAKYIERYRWIAWVGLLVILYVAIKMIWDGWHDVHPHFMNLIGG